jgi:hypothetical protein
MTLSEIFYFRSCILLTTAIFVSACQPEDPTVGMEHFDVFISGNKKLDGKEIKLEGYLSKPPIMLYASKESAEQFAVDGALDVSLKDSSNTALHNSECLQKKVSVKGIYNMVDKSKRYSNQINSITEIRDAAGSLCWPTEN